MYGLYHPYKQLLDNHKDNDDLYVFSAPKKEPFSFHPESVLSLPILTPPT